MELNRIYDSFEAETRKSQAVFTLFSLVRGFASYIILSFIFQQ